MIKSFVLGVGLLGAAGCTQSGPLAAPGRIAMASLKAGQDIGNLALSADGKQACVVGSYVEPQKTVVVSTVTQLDLAQKKTDWSRHIAPPAGTANLYAVACRFHGDKLYMVANADTSHATANSKSRVYVYQFDRSGKELRHALVPLATESRVALGLLADGGQLHLIGFGKDTDSANEYYSMFQTSFDDQLGFQTRVTKTGAYTQLSALRASGGHWYIGGDFFPATVSKTDFPVEYANSRIKPGGGYVWSVRPQHQVVTRSENIASAIDAQATIYSLSQAKGKSSLIAVDAGGKAGPAKIYQSTLCTVDALSAGARYLLALRRGCGAERSKRSVVLIDPAAGTEKEVDLLGAAPKIILAEGDRWYGVSASGGTVDFVFGALEGQ